MIDLYASQPHYLDHLLHVTADVVCRTIVPDERMERYAHARGAPWVMRGSVRYSGGPTLIGGYADMRAGVHRDRPLGLVEHGAGQQYADVQHQGYAGGPGWSRLSLVLVPGPHAADAWRAAYPTLRVVEVGAPPRPAREGPPDGTVAFTFHWPCGQTAESGTAFYDWRQQVARWAMSHPDRTIGHWHPKWEQRRRENPVEYYWESLGVAMTNDPDVLFREADLLVCDNTSLAYEWAATGRPVLSLNARTWRRDVNHGLRFWSHVPGLMLDPDQDLPDGIDAAFTDGLPLRMRRRRAVAQVYRGSVEDATSALTAWVRA